MPEYKTTRRDFIIKSSLIAGGAFIPSMFHIGRSKPGLDDAILGHGDFKYRVHKEWGNLNPENTPVKKLPRDGDGLTRPADHDYG